MATPENLPDPDTSLDPALPQKKRARRRLVGAIALCLAAVIVFPLLFEQEPHRGADEVKVQIPSRDTPLPAPGVAGGVSGAAGGGAAGSGSAAGGAAPDSAAPAARADGKSEPGSDGKATTRADAKADQKPDQKAHQKPDQKADHKPAPRADARADSRSEGKAESRTADSKADAKTDRSRRDGKAAGDGKRYLLQVGAFATEKGAADQAAKVRAAGLAVFTEKVRTAQGDRIRVRVGPFPSREQAEQARGQLKLVGIDSALIAP